MGRNSCGYHKNGMVYGTHIKHTTLALEQHAWSTTAALLPQLYLNNQLTCLFSLSLMSLEIKLEFIHISIWNVLYTAYMFCIQISVIQAKQIFSIQNVSNGDIYALKLSSSDISDKVKGHVNWLLRYEWVLDNDRAHTQVRPEYSSLQAGSRAKVVCLIWVP